MAKQQLLTVHLGGGLNVVDAPESLAPNEAVQLSNLRLTGAGRWTPRKAARALESFSGTVLATIPFGYTTYTPDAGGAERDSAAVVLEYDAANQTVRVNLIDASGGSKHYVGDLAGWSTLAGAPTPSFAVIGTVLFVADEERAKGLTCYDPNNVLQSGALNGLFQPKFDFDGDSTPGVMLCSRVAEYENHLLAFGFNTETDPDRAEAVRVSYRGLVFDPLGGGDAGDTATPGSTGLFDVERILYFVRGVPLLGGLATDGMLAIGTPYQMYRFYGSDWLTFGSTLIDPERGLVSSRALVNADGVLYWLSPLGAARYMGRVEPLMRELHPRLAQMDFSSVFAVHARDQHQVRWYYALATEAGEDPDRYLAYDYRAGAWSEGALPFRVRCAGWARPGTGASPVPQLPGPAGPPSSLTHDSITQTSARATWVNGDAAPGTKTRVYRAPDNGAGAPAVYSLIAEVDAGVGAFTHSGLTAATDYWTKVEHVRNGQLSASVEATFTTNAAAVVNPPLNPSAIP
ncbi:MAG TPA: hypothetical protein VFI96_06925, partial [Longimicrobiaceae bacterium]|nr:hypothetical protein [Longimicrobiaceae bacterium]